MKLRLSSGIANNDTGRSKKEPCGRPIAAFYKPWGPLHLSTRY